MFSGKDYSLLKSAPEYRDYKKKGKIRCVGSLLMIVIMWIIVMMSLDFSNLDDVAMIYIGILILASIVLIRFMFVAFVKKPIMVFSGEVIDIRENIRTVYNAQSTEMATRTTHEYLVSNGDVEEWATCIYDFNLGREKSHRIGEQVLFFSTAPRNSFIVSKEE